MMTAKQKPKIRIKPDVKDLTPTSLNMVEEIGAFLQAAGIGLTVGLNLFCGYLPDDPTVCVGLLEVVGDIPMHKFSGKVNVIDQPRLQVQCRDTTYHDARNWATKIEDVLDCVGNRKIPDDSGTFYISIIAAQSPWLFQRLPDEHLLNMFTVAQMFQIRKKRT